MAIDILVMGACLVWGVAAFPRDDADVRVLAGTGRGNTATCTIQGFFLQVSFLAALSYYSLFSVYSYLGVPNNFRRWDTARPPAAAAAAATAATATATAATGGLWPAPVLEKCLHAAAHGIPLIPAVVNLVGETYNPTHFGYCLWSTRWPWYCGSPAVDYLPCDRGSPETTRYAAVLLPETFLLVLPAALMAALYRKVKRNQPSIRLPAGDVAKQSLVYLGMLLWVTIPMMVVEISAWWNDHRRKDQDHTDLTAFILIAFANIQCFGICQVVVYRYFSHERFFCFRSRDSIVGNHRRRSSGISILNRRPRKDGGGGSTTAGASNRSSNRSSQRSNISFNIFDGTNAAGAFALFVYEGDEEDEEEDERETRQSEGLQGL